MRALVWTDGREGDGMIMMMKGTKIRSLAKKDYYTTNPLRSLDPIVAGREKTVLSLLAS